MYDRNKRIWTVEQGDTLSKIASVIYGDYKKYTKIRDANSDLIKDEDLIYPGWKLYIPTLIDKPKTRIIGSEKDSEFLIVVNNTELNFITQLSCSSGLNFGSRIAGFSAPFEIAGGFKYGDSVQIFLKNELFIDGILLRPEPSYSKSGGSLIAWQIGTKVNNILNSQFKTSASRPGSWENISIADLFSSVLDGFNISVSFSDQSIANHTFKKIGIGSETIFSFLSNVVQQKGLLLYGLPSGDLHCTKSDLTNNVIDNFNNANNISLKLQYDNLASEYRATNQKDKNGSFKTATNNFIKGNVFKQFKKDSGFDGDLQSYVNFKQAKDFADSISIEIVVDDLLTKNGDLWKANKLVSIYVKEIGIDKETLFLIDFVKFEVTKDAKRAILSCVFPETRTNEIPKWMPFL